MQLIIYIIYIIFLLKLKTILKKNEILQISTVKLEITKLNLSFSISNICISICFCFNSFKCKQSNTRKIVFGVFNENDNLIRNILIK